MATNKILLSCIFCIAIVACAFGQHNSVIDTARSQIGVFEATGNNDGEMVETYLATTGLGKGYAWCAAFVNWCHEQNKIHGPNKAAWSPAWFPDSKTIWKRGEVEGVTPAPGDVFGIYFTSKKRIAHVGIIEAWHNKTAITIEGNTNDAGSRDGDGVYRKRRLIKQIKKVSRWRS